MKYLSGGLILLAFMSIQNNRVFGDKPGQNDSRYQLPTAVYDDSFPEPSGRRNLITAQQMITARAIKRGKQRRARIAMQKLSGRSISRPNYSFNSNFYHYNNDLRYLYYPNSWGSNYPYSWNNHSYIRYRTYLD